VEVRALSFRRYCSIRWRRNPTDSGRGFASRMPPGSKGEVPGRLEGAPRFQTLLHQGMEGLQSSPTGGRSLAVPGDRVIHLAGSAPLRNLGCLPLRLVDRSLGFRRSPFMWVCMTPCRGQELR
jgi:hypothetical protein